MTSTLRCDLPVLKTSGSSTPCDGCHAGCCRAYAVPLTGHDIFRITTERKIPFWKYVCRWADPAGQISHGIAPHFFFDDDRAIPYVIGLLQDESRVFPGTRKCVFLDEMAAADGLPRPRARCSIYEDRPVACRVFPARLDEAGNLAVHEKLERSGEREHEAYTLCPRTWSVADLDPREATTSLAECAAEMELFRRVAARWNDEPGPWPLFPEFLRFVYQALSAA